MPLNESVYRRKEREEQERRRREQAVELARNSQNDSNSNSANSSASSQNSTQTSQRGSQSPSSVDKLFESTARKYTNATANDSIRRNSRGQTVSGRDRTRSAVNSPNASVSRAKEDTGKWAKNEAYGALTGFNRELFSTIDFLLPDVITPEFIQKGINSYKEADEEQQRKIQELRGDSKLREIAGTIGGETLKNIPSAVLALGTGGVSAGAQVAGEAVPSLLEGARLANTSNVISRALNEVRATSGRNPMFWETFMRTVGPTYDNEIANGADPGRAMLSAYANALLNAQIEIGGGIEKYDPSEVFWKAALRSAKEEGMEEVQQYAVENLVNKAIGSNRTKDKNGNTIETPWFSMDRGVNAVINPVDMAEQGFYGAAAGGLMSGGRTLGVNAVNDARNNNYRQEHPDFEEHAKDLIQRASVQGREGEMSTRAQNLAEEVSEQMARGQQPTAYQMRELESAVATDEYYNQKAYENSSQERYNQAVEEGKADTVKQTGTADEYYGFRRGLNETEQRNYEKAKAVMGENASENSVLAVSKLMTGSESNRDIDTILLDPEARSAVEELAEVTLPINNVKARAELENIALVNQIANRDKILEQTHKDIRTNMSRRGGELFDENYDEAVKTLDVPNAAEIYENFFSRFYTAGTVEDADFEKTYNRIISPLVEDFGEDFGSRISQVFNHDFAQKVFAQGQIAMNSVRAKAQGRSLSVKASENPAGFTYEEEARKHISDREADLFTKLAERAKVHIRLVSSIAGGQANGSYDPETGVILIAADSDNKFITVFKHELTHHLKNTSPELYQKLEDFVFKKWYDGDPEKMEERVQEYQRRYNMRPDQAREEIIADASEAFFTDEGAINEAVTFNEKMARAIHDGIKSLLDTFLDLVDTDRRADKGYGDFLKDLDILRDAEKMWLEALNDSVGKQKGNTESGAFVDNSTGENVQFSLRTEAPPKKTRKGYKVFVVKNGELYPPMVANPNGDPTPVGVWLNADEGVRAGTSKTGRPQVQAGGKGTQGGSGTLAYRPGWHLGEIPLAKQFMRQDANGNKTLFPKNFVWAECDIAADNDYQEEAMSYGYTENGKFRHAYAGLPKIPKDGFYQYRTNPNPDTVPWLITGAMKINRILSDAEVSDILAKEGIEAPKRQGGDKTLEELGIKKVKFSRKTMSEKYEADEKLTHSQFNRWYSAHKLDLRGIGNIPEQIESIKANGFRGDGGFMGNIMPASVNDSLDRDGLPRSFFKDEKGWDDEKIDSYLNQHKWVDDIYYPGMTVSDQRYGVRKGETVLLVPRTWTDQKFGRVKQGFKPREYEIVTADRNFQPYYELYEKAYDEAHKKYSLKDSDGNTLSKGQQEYFKDSKVRDNDGNLLVMYHGTQQKGFTVFNPSESQDGISLFFTDKLDVAKGYSGVKKTFAPKIEKPTLAKIQKALEREDDGYHHYKIAKTDNGYEVFRFEYDWDLGEDGEWVRNDRKVNDWFNYEAESLEDIANYIKREFSNIDESTNYKVYLNLVNPLIVNANGRYFDQLGDLFEGLEDTRAYAEYAKRNGYDGVIFKDIIDTAVFASNEERFEESNVVIAFSSNQIKSVANKNPTENPDIRYSKKDDKDYMDAVNKGDMETAQKMVDEEAKKHGLTNRLMHGTNSFGFTTVEYGKGDDHISFFATDNEEVASSYVRQMGEDYDEPNSYVRSIGKPNRSRLTEKSSVADIIKELNKSRPSSYKVATEAIIKSEVDKQFKFVLEDAKELNRYTLPDNVQTVIEKVANSKDPKEAISLMDSIKDVHDIYYNDMFFYVANAKLSGLRSNIDLLKKQLKWTPDNTAYWEISGQKIFVSSQDVYEEYLDESGMSGRGIYELYATTKKPLTIPCYGETWDNIKVTGEMADDLGERATTREIAKWAYEHGYGTVIFDYVRDTGKYGDRFTNPSTVYAFLEGGNNVIKSADPVTYDDDGNVIPLSERFNESNEDIRYSLKKAPPVEELDKSGATLTTNNGQPIAKFEENGSVQFSLKTYDDQGRRIYKEYLDKMVKNGQLSRVEAKQMFDEIETIYKISREFADTGKYAPFTAWSSAQVVTGENGKPVFSAIKKNSEYKMNIDFSTICKKRRTLDNVFRVMVNRGLFEKLDLNKDESAALVVNINDLIREHGFEAACALCFVEARRYRQQQTATTFRDMWNGLVESMYKDKSKIEYFNYGENNEKKPVPDGIHTMPDKDLNLTKLKRLANAKNDEGKPLQTAEAKAARLLLRDPSQRKLMLVGDMMASTGFENMQVKNPELMKIYNAKKGTGGAKSSFGDVQYLNEILRPRTFGRMSAYAVSGVRIQSFSDYVPRMVFDYVQVIGDLAAKRLPAHAYTKEVLFALQFGLTGAKINMSLVPDVVADGVAPGLDKNGNYIWNKEGTFPWEDYVDKNGRKMPGARSIQKAKGYKEHCGTIAVGISDAQIWKMLLDPEIQMVIPYHKSSLNPLVAAMTNVDRFTDYTDYQNTRDKNGKAVEKEFDWDRKLFRLSHGSNNKLLPRSEWGDVQALVKEYVDWCNKHEYTPKFNQFLYMREGNSMDGDFILDENGNKVINPGYYKMLEDFALYDNDGKFKPQDDVRMNFPTDESAYGSMASLIEQGLDEDAKLEAKRTNEIDGIVDEIESMIEDGSITKQTIFSEALADKMEDKFQYSLKSGGESRNYQNTISKLENQVKDLKAEFKRTDLKTADPKDVRIQAGKLIKRHNSNMSVQGELVDTFNRIFKLYKENGTDSFDDIYEIAKNAAVEVVNNISIVHDEGAEDYKAIKEYLKETPIVITEDMKKNITDFNDFRKRYFGKLKLVNGTTGNIDNVYMELNEMFPGQFTEDYVNPADQLYHMADVLDNYAPYYETLDGASPEMQDYVVDIAADIMETAYGLQTKKTFADKKYEEKVKAVAKARQKALESRDSALNRQKQRYEKKIEDLKAHNLEMRANRKARREDSEARTKLLKIARRLDRFKTTAAKREQIDALIGDLDLVAKGMTDKTLENLHDLRDWYSDRKETDPDFIADSNIEKKLERLSKKHIKDMDLADVRELYDVLSNIENELKTERKLINSEMRKDIKEAGRETIRNINNSKGLAMKTRGFDRFFINGTLSPLRQIRRVTGYNDNDPLYIATKELADGQRKMLDYQMTSWKAFDRFMKNKDFLRSINGPKAKEIEITGIKDGKQYKTKITPDIRMAMYLASMNADNLRHMRDGGVKLPDIKLYKKGKISEAMEKGTIVKFSPSMLNEITSHMTKTERAFAQEAYKYYNETSPEAINKVSEELKGYSLARVQNYYPIHTDSNFLSKEFEAMKFDGTIEGMGFLKERVRASNPIQMTGLVDELTRSIEMNSKYVGLAIPVRNFGKIYGVNDVTYTERNEGGVKTLEADYRGSVKDSISDKWGGAVASYIEKFMTDLQNGRKNYDDWGNFFSKLRSNYAGAVLTLNASVALKQAASYPTAAAVLGRAPLVKAMGNFGKVDLDLIAKYTPLQWYRSQGFSTTELGDIRSGNKQSLLNKYPFLNWIQGIDLATTRKLWKASEYYVQDHNKNLKKGTDEYYKAVADIYNRVIEETQPNYTTMQRPGLLRSDNDIVLALNMFKTQPYQNFNILYDSIGNYVAKRNQYNKVKNADTKKALQDAGRDMRNAIDSQIMQLAVFAAMTSLWALFRRKDDKYRDKEGNLTFVSYLERLAKDMLANSFAVVPFGSDIYGTVSSSITGEYYYGFSSVTDSSITDLLDTFTKGYKTIGEWVQYAMNDDPEKEKPDGDMYKDIVSVSESASRFLGAPFSNMKNLATGIYGWVAISKDGEYVGSYEALKMSFAKDTEKKELLMKAYRNDSKAYEELRKMMIEDGFKEDSLDYYIRKQTRENPDESGQTRYQEMVTYLEGSPMLWTNNNSTYKEAYDKVLRDIALGIETSTTESYTKYEGIGLKPEELVLVKLAMEKADQMYGNKNGYLDTDEKEKGLDMLAHLHLTEKEKEAIKKIKFNFDKKG